MVAALDMSSLERPYEKAQECFNGIVDYLDAGEAQLMSHSELERELEKMGRELLRLLLQEHIDRRGHGRCGDPVKGADGVERTQVRPHSRILETVFGSVTSNRVGYGQKGVDSLHPFDAELNLPKERYSLELRRRVAEEAARNSYDETIATIASTTGAHVPKRQIEELAMRAAQDFEDFYDMRQCDPERDPMTGSILAISADGKGIVLHEKDLKEQTRKAAATRSHKMEKRLSKGEKKNAKRMATVAAVYTTQPFMRTPMDLVTESSCRMNQEKPPRPENKRVWASVAKMPEQVIGEAFAEAFYRDPEHQKQWVALVDGDRKQIRILQRLARKHSVNLTIIVDIVHVIEYLWNAGRVFHPESGPDLEEWVRVRFMGVLQGKAGLIAGGMRRSATRRELCPEKRKPVDTCAKYLLNKSPYLHYDRYLAQGYPIATGVIEGACRHLVKDRMDVTGAKWRLNGAEAILRLRALRSSNDFGEYWEYHEACEYKRNHQDLYKGSIVPLTTNQKSALRKTKLKRIK